MHRGRIFRRVLPPALTPNYAADSHAPVYLRIGFQVELGTGFLRGQVISEVARPTYSQGQIDWAATFIKFPSKYRIAVTVRLIEHSPDHLLQFFIVDEQANSSTMVWRVAPGVGRWGPFGDNYFFPGEQMAWSEPFGPVFAINLQAVTYPEEPPLP